jgi:putative redox protein
MLEVSVEHLGGVQFEVNARGLKLLCDQPVESGGFNEGMTPPELLLASLGTCAGYYAAEYLRKHKIAGEGTRVRVSAEKVKGPARMDRFLIEVEVPDGLSASDQHGVEQAVHRCLIHNTLLQPPSIGLVVRTGAAHERDAHSMA